MLPLPEEEIKKRTKHFVKESLWRSSYLLDNSKEIFGLLFPSAKVKGSKPEQKATAQELVDFKVQRMKDWLFRVFQDAKALSLHQVEAAEPPSEIRLPRALTEDLIKTLLQIFTCGRDLTDADFYFVSDVTGALNLEVGEVKQMVEQAQYEIRKIFFQVLVDEMDQNQCYECAVLVMKAIVVDDKLHPAEMKYLENISQLLRYDQALIEAVEEEAKKEGFPQVELPRELAEFMLRYLTEIVMVDGEYEPRESEFIQAVGRAFGFSKEEQEEVIQPVAAALMVKAALFPKM